MAEIGTAGAVVGLVMAAAHVTRALSGDIKSIIGAPSTVRSLTSDLDLLISSVVSLERIEEHHWGALDSTVAATAKAAILTCNTTCESQREDLKEWTKRSGAGKRSWREQVNLGFFKKSHVKSMSRQLQSCKSSLDLVVSTATLYAANRTSTTVDSIKVQLNARDCDMTALAATTARQTAEIEQAIANMRITEQPQGQEEDEAESGQDRESAEAALEQELATVKVLQDLVALLQAELKEKSPEQIVKQIQNNFGANNHGVQLGENIGTMNNSFSGGPK